MQGFHLTMTDTAIVPHGLNGSVTKSELDVRDEGLIGLYPHPVFFRRLVSSKNFNYKHPFSTAVLFAKNHRAFN
jgi:hypothetical protein